MSSSKFNRNPTGKNQHGDVPKADDPDLAEALVRFHGNKIASNKRIRDLLAAEWSQTDKQVPSTSTIKRRRNELGLYGSKSKKLQLSETEKRQLVLEQLEKDPLKRHGLANVHARIAFDRGVHLKRDEVSQIMHTEDKDGFESREPGGKKIPRVQKVMIGIHERWAGDGHDKLYSIGFPIWAVVDDATSRWLRAWILPSNRMGDKIAYCYILLVIEYKGLPMEFSTDCGSETTYIFALGSALREILFPEYPVDELPAHRYLRSVHNITIERSWLRLKLDFGDNAVAVYNKGIDDGVFNPTNTNQYNLSRWLWPKLLQQELDKFMAFRNGVRMRKDKNKAGPSGCSRNEAFLLHENYGLGNKLLPLDDKALQIVCEIRDLIGGPNGEILDFVVPEFASICEDAYRSLGISELSMDNVWDIFTALMPCLYPSGRHPDIVYPEDNIPCRSSSGEVSSTRGNVVAPIVHAQRPSPSRSLHKAISSLSKQGNPPTYNMAKCTICTNDFPLLESQNDAGTRCSKCQMRKPGLSQAELACINGKPQCAACGVCSSTLEQPLCMTCIQKYRNAKYIPTEILKLRGVTDALLLDTRNSDQMSGLLQVAEPGSGAPDLPSLSSEANQVIGVAARYHASASDSRLAGTGRSTINSGPQQGAPRLINLSKAMAVKRERKLKHEEVNARQKSTSVKVQAALWGTSGGQTVKIINPIRVTKVFPDSNTISAKAALSEVLEIMQIDFAKHFTAAKKLDWSNITLYAHQSATAFASLAYFDMRGSLANLFREFQESKLNPERVLADKTLEIRFMCSKENIFTEDGDSDSYRSHIHKLSRKRKSSVIADIPAKRTSRIIKSAVPLRSAFISSGALSGPSDSIGNRPVLRSAFMKVPKWSRDGVKMESWKFVRTVANYTGQGLDVQFEKVADEESIEIAMGWADDVNSPGMIGKGFTKRGIYARFQDKEYVVTQPFDEHMSPWDVQAVLRAEYALLCIGNFFKGEFDKHANESSGKSRTIPEFYFNFKGSIFGELVLSKTSSSCALPHRYFIATPMLPCGPVDPPVKKFTGNDMVGKPDDHMTKAIHAFAHFMTIYSASNIVLCDLQGTLDSRGTMCLIDPQAHTVAPDDHVCKQYWDLGTKGIKKFEVEHEAHCADNWVCNALKLRDIIVQPASPVKKPDTERKTRLSFICQGNSSD